MPPSGSPQWTAELQRTLAYGDEEHAPTRSKRSRKKRGLLARLRARFGHAERDRVSTWRPAAPRIPRQRDH